MTSHSINPIYISKIIKTLDALEAGVYDICSTWNPISVEDFIAACKIYADVTGILDFSSDYTKIRKQMNFR